MYVAKLSVNNKQDENMKVSLRHYRT